MKAVAKSGIAEVFQPSVAANQSIDRRSRGTASVLLTQLHALNFDYLQLLVSRSSSISPHWRLPDTTARSLDGLPNGALRSISQCPYALFDLGLDDAEYWQSLLSGRLTSSDWRDSRLAPPAYRFTAAALFYFWHAIHTDLIFVRYVCGMDLAIAGRIRDLAVTEIARAAWLASDRLCPRWPQNPSFWPDLIRFVSATDSIQFQVSKLLGCQLLAATQSAPLPRGRTPSAAVSTQK